MVYVNNKKFACESCIKGHRSSSCHHTDRPLFEIKKKGRPVSQCEKCRELRQSKKLHSKCTCMHKPDPREATQPLVSSSTSKTRRFIPIVPALPNGLKDVLVQSLNPPPADERQTVDSLLNPCNCRSLWKCKCKAGAKEKPASRQLAIASGLSALANVAAAAMECSPSSSSSFPEAPGKRPIHRRSPAAATPMAVNKRQRHEKQSFDRSQKIHLPPLLHTESLPSSSPPTVPAVPDFDFMPPIEQITSLAGSGCTCGVRCACPGCVEHRGRSDHADHEERRNCADGCGTCVDPSLEFSLPLSTGAGSSSFAPYFHPESSNGLVNDAKESFLDRFFARAAALPPPPYRKRSVILDPMDTTVYLNKAGPPVTLPKLECCGGQCICPEGQCSCRSSCVGCGVDEVEESPPSVPTQKASSPAAMAAAGSGL